MNIKIKIIIASIVFVSSMNNAMHLTEQRTNPNLIGSLPKLVIAKDRTNQQQKLVFAQPPFHNDNFLCQQCNRLFNHGSLDAHLMAVHNNLSPATMDAHFNQAAQAAHFLTNVFK